MASKAYEDMCAEIIGNLHIQLKEAELEVYRLTKLLQEHRDKDALNGGVNIDLRQAPIDCSNEINKLKAQGIL